MAGRNVKGSVLNGAPARLPTRPLGKKKRGRLLERSKGWGTLPIERHPFQPIGVPCRRKSGEKVPHETLYVGRGGSEWDSATLSHTGPDGEGAEVRLRAVVHSPRKRVWGPQKRGCRGKEGRGQGYVELVSLRPLRPATEANRKVSVNEKEAESYLEPLLCRRA